MKVRSLRVCGWAMLVAWLAVGTGGVEAQRPAVRRFRPRVPAAPAAVKEQPPAVRTVAEVECRRATGKIRIDGKLDEAAWGEARAIEDFVVFWENRAAKTRTVARLLWDDEALYFAAEMEDADLYADITEKDGQTWLNDVFELFFKPHDDRLGYYEFQVNAAGTRLDMYLPSRGSGGYARWAKAHRFGMQAAVHREGTLNDATDIDRGWTVEGRIPWTGFSPTGGRPAAGDVWRAALCRYDYSVQFESPELSSIAPLSQANFHRYEDYPRLRFVEK